MDKMTKIKTLVIDDEPFAREGVKLLLANDREIEITGEAQNGPEAVKMIKKLRPDLIFLDIQMPGMDGFKALDELFPGEIPIVVFVTAFDQYAIKAFEANAIDYLLKPFDDDRFYAALEKAKKTYRMIKNVDLNEKMINLLEEVSVSNKIAVQKKEYNKRISVKDANVIKVINVEEIDFIEAADYYSIIHCGSKKYMIRETMKSFEDTLDPEIFIRIHRSTIININQIASIQLYGKDSYLIITRLGNKFDISRSRLEKLKTKLGLK